MRRGFVPLPFSAEWSPLQSESFLRRHVTTSSYTHLFSHSRERGGSVLQRAANMLFLGCVNSPPQFGCGITQYRKSFIAGLCRGVCTHCVWRGSIFRISPLPLPRYTFRGGQDCGELVFPIICSKANCEVPTLLSYDAKGDEKMSERTLGR